MGNWKRSLEGRTKFSKQFKFYHEEGRITHALLVNLVLVRHVHFYHLRRLGFMGMALHFCFR